MAPLWGRTTFAVEMIRLRACAHPVQLRGHQAELDYEKGPLGYPTTDEKGTLDGRGRYNQFSKGGAIYWTPQTGAHAIYGEIYNKWAELKWETGPPRARQSRRVAPECDA
jgi:hypothetical protein